MEQLITRSLEIKYPVVYSALSNVVYDEYGLPTQERIPRDPTHLNYLDNTITQIMKSRYSDQLARGLTNDPIFFIDGYNKYESHIIYDLLFQVIQRYLDAITSNEELVECIKNIDADYMVGDTYETICDRIRQAIRRKEGGFPPQESNSGFWTKERKDIIGSDAHEAAVYWYKDNIFELLAQCLKYTVGENKMKDSYCYCINPGGLTPHEQKILARLLERGYTKTISQAYCFIKINNSMGGWKTYRSFESRSAIQDIHDYTTYSFKSSDLFH